MSLTNKDKIEICKYYEENHDKLGTTKIEGYEPQDVANFLVSILGEGGGTIRKVED